jgi:xeroderma pigmentosum group C-complementing protein
LSGHDDGERKLYGYWQTEEYSPPEIVEGVIPVNKFGNIELFHENMLPRGAVHVVDAGSAAVAKKLGIGYAKAVIGFNHTRQGAVPIMQGIVVEQENEQLIRDVNRITQGVREQTEQTQRKEREKRSRRALEKWARFTVGLLSKERLMREYMPKD